MYGVPFAWIKSLHARAIKHVHRQHQLALYTQIIFRHCRVIGRRNDRTASEPPNRWNTSLQIAEILCGCQWFSVMVQQFCDFLRVQDTGPFSTWDPLSQPMLVCVLLLVPSLKRGVSKLAGFCRLQNSWECPTRNFGCFILISIGSVYIGCCFVEVRDTTQLFVLGFSTGS